MPRDANTSHRLDDCHGAFLPDPTILMPSSPGKHLHWSSDEPLYRRRDLYTFKINKLKQFCRTG